MITYTESIKSSHYFGARVIFNTQDFCISLKLSIFAFIVGHFILLQQCLFALTKLQKRY
jgi:hypothetical protein